MVRFALFVLPLFFPVASAAAGQAPTPADLAQQNLAIAVSVQEQLLACWSLPPGYEDKRISVGLAFFGDGTLDGEPYVELDSVRTAGQYPVFMQSIAAAIAACLPFEGLGDLGAGSGERFDITVHFQS
ncbi:hypothetical protein [Devosia sediminis]|uniref:TonB C-terminal domain-containing protein n=1 Tax=Devosia sediminis TaxID=2798801 RepID=A0A934MM35_9HYPH|nr:hypothetical protein [Devosia sediminis]MBJ3785790.1 hypothetical protein [Devosia sediminis]